jgi:folate-binding protein YgfZ
MTTALAEAARAHGATLGDLHGVLLAASYGDSEREWRAAREGAVVFDAGFRTSAMATGGDRVTFLHGMLSNDVKSLREGQGLYAAMLTQSGKVVADARVYAEADRIALDAFAWSMDDLLASLEHHLVADDVELTRPADDVPLLGVEGPFARAALAEALGAVELPGQPFAHAPVAFQGRSIRVACASELGGEGFLVRGDPALALPLFDACREAGAMPIGTTALDVLRVEQGVPWPKVDMDENVLIMEAGLDRAISFTKGCYLGQEVVERVAARGRVNRKLIGLVIEGDTLPAHGAAVRSGGSEAGIVTSAVRSFAVGHPIALAIVHRKFLEPPARFDVEVAGGPAAAVATELPFEAGR